MEYDPFEDPPPVSEGPPPKRQKVGSTQGSAPQRAWEFVRPLRNPSSLKLCVHFLQDDCRWGSECRFSHDKEELRRGAPVTTEMDFRSLDADHTTSSFAVPRDQRKVFMTAETAQALCDASGGGQVEWEPSRGVVTVSGTAAQVESAGSHVRRVTTHCKWGANPAKIVGILRLCERTTARLRLAPMVPTLRQVDVTLAGASLQLTMGSDASNHVPLKGSLISRAHVVLEFMPSKGAVYIADVSTNGTFLNGVRLPPKSSGKVLVWHGDELLFPEPGKDVRNLEFGYMVNLEFI